MNEQERIRALRSNPSVQGAAFDFFRQVWDVLAGRGECDALGSQQHLRLMNEWWREQALDEIATFISVRARQ